MKNENENKKPMPPYHPMCRCATVYGIIMKKKNKTADLEWLRRIFGELVADGQLCGRDYDNLTENLGVSEQLAVHHHFPKFTEKERDYRIKQIRRGQDNNDSRETD